MQEVPTTSMMDAAIQYATDLIRGGLGGYVVMTPGPNGYPQEILIMDEPNKDDAVNVWRFNQGGLGHSSTGYEGPFSDIALTADGKINASMITTGILNANVIRAGTITDEDGLNYWNLESGQFVTKQGQIGGFDITENSLEYLTSTKLIRLNNRGITSTSKTSYATLGASINEGKIEFLGRSNSSSPEQYDVLYYFEIGMADGVTPWLNFEYGLNMNVFSVGEDWFDISGEILAESLVITGTKSRRVETDNYLSLIHI